jgi:hypothetical protein
MFKWLFLNFNTKSMMTNIFCFLTSYKNEIEKKIFNRNFLSLKKIVKNQSKEEQTNYFILIFIV